MVDACMRETKGWIIFFMDRKLRSKPLDDPTIREQEELQDHQQESHL